MTGAAQYESDRSAPIRVLLLAALLGCSPTPSSESAAVVARAAPTAAARSSTAVVVAPVAGSLDASADGDGGQASAAPRPCPDDMVTVAGSYCDKLEQRCLRPRKPWQCAEFEAPGTCVGPERSMRYCIDRYEHPNRAGALPTVMSSWRAGKKACEELGKRLCSEAEWTLACEGPERLAFPYGHLRDAEACAIDKSSPRVNERRLFSTRTREAELARLDQREPSGARARCVSAYGVHDLTGNVDEWVVNEAGRPHHSSLKGGNWGEYRNACRPATRGHDEGFYYYQTGFRCCRDADAG